ncbi:MAG TPA: response regulator transcription factor, partial [Ktedonobacteraceae bacterium]
MRKRILVVEDEKEIVRLLQRSLTAHGYEVQTAESGESALAILEAQPPPDALLLDLGLPDISGLEVCKRIRAQSPLPPIIVLSVRSKERDKVRALDLGADDYIAKPFGINEVLARIRVALRHASYVPLQREAVITIGPLRLDLNQQLVFLNEQEIKLTPTEYNLLKILIENRGKILTQQVLLRQVWGKDPSQQTHYLHVYMSHLRRKIEPDPLHPRFLHTLSGIGYR